MDRDRRVLKGIDRIEPILRRLCGHRVRDPHLWIEPEVRLNRSAGVEGNINAVCHILLGEAELRGPNTINIEMQSGRIDDLMHVNIDCPGNSRQALAEPTRNLVVGRVITLYLNIDGRRKSEVENLHHHVGRLEEEGEIREPVL